MFQVGLYNFLSSQPLLTALIGTPGSRADKSAGIFPVLALNEATLPYITFQQISGAPITSMQGSNRLHSSRWRFSCYGSNYPSAQNVAEALELIFAVFTGTLSSGDVLQHAEVILRADDMESIPHGTLYKVHLDLKMLYADMC